MSKIPLYIFFSLFSFFFFSLHFFLFFLFFFFFPSPLLFFSLSERPHSLSCHLLPPSPLSLSLSGVAGGWRGSSRPAVGRSREGPAVGRSWSSRPAGWSREPAVGRSSRPAERCREKPRGAKLEAGATAAVGAWRRGGEQAGDKDGKCR